MTREEFQPIAAKLTRASLVIFPAAPPGEPSKFDEWARALDDLTAAEVDAAVDWLIRYATGPVGQPGIIRSRVMVDRVPKAPLSQKRVEYDEGRVYRCATCQDTGWEPTKTLRDGVTYDAVRRCACSPQNGKQEPTKRVGVAANPFDQVKHRSDIHD